MSEKIRRLTYRSPATDDVWVPCDNVDELLTMFKNEADEFANDPDGEPFTVEIGHRAMTDEEVDALPTI